MNLFIKYTIIYYTDLKLNYGMYVYIYVYVHIHTHNHIYIYMY